MVMLMVGFLSWWYTRGWATFVQKFINKLRGMADFFSLGLLFKTFFAPFRQLDAYTSDNASLQQQFHEFFDKLLSRLVGAAVRFLVIICGIISLVATMIGGFLAICIWPVMPILPIVGIILTMTGVAL